MKKIILMLAIATFSTGTLVAQSTVNPAPAGRATPPAKPVTPAERADRLTQRMTAQLTLTPEQSAKIKAINLQRVSEQQTLRQKAVPNREAIRALQQKYQAQYQAVLTPEQYAKYEASQAPRGSAAIACGAKARTYHQAGSK